MTLNDAQQRAVTTTDRNLAVVAGAGSGKTHVLVERLLALLARYPAWPLGAVVAVTFTRKAAAELRVRVRAGLVQRMEAATSATEQSLWRRHLAAMDGARITTIHGLCTDILRANAPQAGLPPDFAVLDEGQAALLRAQVARATLHDLAEQNHPALEVFAHYNTYSHVFAQFVAQLGTGHVPPPADTDPQHVLARWHNAHQGYQRAVVHGLVASAAFREALAWGQAHAPFTTGDKLGATWDGALQIMLAFAANPDGGAHHASMLAGVRLTGGSAKGWGDEATFTQAKDVLKAVREQAARAKAALDVAPAEADAVLHAGWATLLRAAHAAYDRGKRAQAVLDFSDLEAYTLTLLDTVPGVAARYVGQAFRHMLVDEFQDTNDRQSAIVAALTAWDADADPPRDPAPLFVVGDPKQSIYAFRGADVRVFQRIRQQLASHARGETILLTHTYRAHTGLVAHINALFQRVFDDLSGNDFSVRYEPMVGERQPPTLTAPCVLVARAATLPDEAAWVAADIAARVRDGTPIHDRSTGQTRQMRCGDTVLLFRASTSMAAFERALDDADVPYVTIGGRQYWGRQELGDLLALLSALHNPHDDLSLAVALRSPLFALSDEALWALRRLPNPHAEAGHLSLADVLAYAWAHAVPGLTEDQAKCAHHAAALLAALRDQVGCTPVGVLLRRVLAHTAYRAVLTGLHGRGPRRRANIEKLLALADSENSASLGAFLARASDYAALADVREGDATLDVTDAVTLMTVHAAKGLEFPVVYLVNTGSQRQGGSFDHLRLDADGGLVCRPARTKAAEPFAWRVADDQQKQRDAAEHARLLYVAATRAQDVLVVSGHTPASGSWLATWLAYAEAHPNDRTLAVYDLPRVAVAAAVRPPISSWNDPHVRRGAPLPGLAKSPPLVAVIPSAPPPMRQLSATQTAELSYAITQDAAARAQWRAQLRDGAPPPAAELGHLTDKRLTHRQLGEVVHRALRAWRFPTGDAGNDAILHTTLKSAAWSLGVVDATLQDRMAQMACVWLMSFQGTGLYQDIQAALAAHPQHVLREVPLAHKVDGVMIHGVLDVLFRNAKTGKWVLADYKSAWLPNPQRHDDGFKQHARRYHAQLAVYAEAAAVFASRVDNRPVLPREVLSSVHYIRYDVRVSISPVQRQLALRAVNADLSAMLLDEEG